MKTLGFKVSFLNCLFIIVVSADEVPYLLPGGDLIDFSLPENTPVNSVVYTLKGYDPEDGENGLSYTISGDTFTINQKTGAISLAKGLDREKEKSISVVITLQDSAFHLIPFRREIQVLDINDNAPIFLNEPYRFSIPETAAPGSVISSSILVSDQDTFDNAKISLTCLPNDSTDISCDYFNIKIQELAPGSIAGHLELSKALNYEKKSNYKLRIRAQDFGSPKRLSSTSEIFINLIDVQDQPPVFINSPYLSTIPENTEPGTKIFDIKVRDGDTGNPSQIGLDIVGDPQGFFRLESSDGVNDGPIYSYQLLTSDSSSIDRESPVILSNGGLINFQIRARELLSNPSGAVGDESLTNVTVIIKDEDDTIPLFNKDSLVVALQENVGFDTPLPDLNLMVEDTDSPFYAEFELALEDENGPFSVYPKRAIGKTPVILRVSNPDLLDYESEDKNKYEVKINAIQNGTVKASSLIKVLITDANDNAPVFEKDFYEFSIPENVPPETSLGTINAVDLDSGSFGQVSYDLKGFGADRFRVNSESGEIFVRNCMESEGLWSESCLDYETQDMYSLTYTGTDGGNEISTVTVNIRILDVNDNYPKFQEANYTRRIPEGSPFFDPKLIVRATDADGISQGGGKVFYSIHSINTELTLFTIDAVTGEISLLSPLPSLRSSNTPPDGNYQLVIRATDNGKPPLYSDAKVLISVDGLSHERPIFESGFYSGSLAENAPSGTLVLGVKAKSIRGHITYDIFSGAKDNFVIDAETGEIFVSEDADLDIQENGDSYNIIVLASNNLEPHPQVSMANVSISIEDVNNKPPKFDQESYTRYVNEQIPIGKELLMVQANDPDRNSLLHYSLVPPVIAFDRAGNLLTNKANYNFSSLFKVSEDSGLIFLNNSLSYNQAAVLILRIRVTDSNADDFPNQVDETEVTIYVQATKVDVPQFHPPWSPSNPQLTFSIPEGQPPGTMLFKISATDPKDTNGSIIYEKLQLSDPNDYITIDKHSGEVFNNVEFDFEALEMKQLTATILARGANERSSEANLIINVEDINDNAPILEQTDYKASLSEASLPHSPVLQIQATDPDSGPFGELEYSLFGPGSNDFDIDGKTGLITVKKGPDGRSLLDREKIPEYELKVLVSDDSQSSSTLARITILDANDEAPIWSESSYSAVMPENSPIGSSLIRLEAMDRDSGDSGRISYQFVEGSFIEKVFEINAETGEIQSKASLTGKGRNDPYILIARALDHGEPQLFTDVEVYVTIGDVSENDGTPTFTSPEIGETAIIPEDANIGSIVFVASATDPDDPKTANGKILYSLPNDGSNSLFDIHPSTGVIRTSDKLDREKRSNYSLIIEARDLGNPSQHASITLNVKVSDVNDHNPVFDRPNTDLPMEISIKEHTNIGTEILTVKAIDEDEGENAEIFYEISEGNEEQYFEIFRTDANEGIVFISKDIDREMIESFTLIIRCFHPSSNNTNDPKSLLRVKILVEDIDDNLPTFTHKNSTFGVRVNSAVYTEIAKIEATDPDPLSAPITYTLLNVTYSRPSSGLFDILNNDLFILDEVTGVLHTNRTLGRYLDGVFELFVFASNAPGRSDVGRIRLYVLQDTELLQFVFDSDPSAVRARLPSLKEEIQDAFITPLEFNLYESEFYSKRDGSLDFGRTGSCFQVLSNEAALDVASSEALVANNPDLQNIYSKYDIINVERCSRIQTSASSTLKWMEILLLVVGALLGALGLIASLALCATYAAFKRALHVNSPVKIIEARVKTFVHASLPPGSTLGGQPSISDFREYSTTDSPPHHQDMLLLNDYRAYENLKATS